MSSPNLSWQLFCATLLIAATVSGIAPGPIQAGQTSRSVLQLTSSAFAAGGNIPAKFSCDGANISPPLSWTGAPPGTRSFALVMHDQDAPISGGYTHWLAYNVPATVNHIPEGAPNQDRIPGGGLQGRNESGAYGYTGPCPPSGTHRYFFRLYVLDSELDPRAGANKATLEKAMQGYILAQTELMGRYKRTSE